MEGGVISGGAIQLPAGHTLNVSGYGSLDHVHLTGGDVVFNPSTSGNTMTVQNGIDAGGRAVYLYNNAYLNLPGSQVLDNVNFFIYGTGHDAGATLSFSTADTLTIGSQAELVAGNYEFSKAAAIC